MDSIRRAAYVAASRAFGFAVLGVFCSMVGMAFDPVVAARTGGTLMTIVTTCFVLIASRADRGDYRRTEAWLILAEHERPKDAVARVAVTGMRREAFLWFARLGAIVSAALWGIALLLRVALPPG